MKKRLFFLCLAGLLVLCGCNTKGGNADFTQKALPAPDDALFMAESPEQLRFQSDRTYRESGDTLLYFYYEKEPFIWINPTGPATELTVLAFLLPGPADTEEHVKSCFMAMKTNDVRDLHGLFTYYFPPEIAASVWDFIWE